MVSSLNLAYIYLCLKEIFGADEWFRGKTMLFVGQLPPVNGAPLFQQVPNKVISPKTWLNRLGEHLERGCALR